MLGSREEMVCPIDLHRDYYEQGGTVKWVSLHPCMHWMCARCAKDCRSRCEKIARQQAAEEGGGPPRAGWTCPMCRAPVEFTLATFRPRG